MKKTELIAAVAEQSGLSKKDAEKALSARRQDPAHRLRHI